MLQSATQDARQLALFTVLGPNALLLERFTGEEGLSELFDFELELLSGDSEIDPRDILGTNATCVMTRDVGAPRFFNGYIVEFAQLNQTARGIAYRAKMVPWTWFLSQSVDCRIFQAMTAPQIIREVVATFGFAADFDDSGLTADYRQREYCVQYRETAFNFISRLMEEEGIFYRFEHANGLHSLILADTCDGYVDIDENQVSIARVSESSTATEHLLEWNRSVEFGCGRITTSDYDFENPRLDISASKASRHAYLAEPGLEIFCYPGRYEQPDVGDHQARIQIEALESAHACVLGRGSRWTFVPGGRFSVLNHEAHGGEVSDFAITRVRYEAGAVGSYISGGDATHDAAVWQVEFRAIDAAVVFRPARRAALPRIAGPQTADVVGPSGKQIHTDEFGRVKCQFRWERAGQHNEDSSCWIRVSQVHAGAGWGSMHVPRIGEEVVVAFIDGNPDRPIIKGRVYNGSTLPPFGLPATKARSGMKSNTHQGSGYNEFSADDSGGSEQIRANAQFDLNQTVGNNASLSVGADRSVQVVGNDELVVGANQSVEIGGDLIETIANNRTDEVGSDVLIKSGTSITLACGASTLHMNQAGVITLSGLFTSLLASATNSIVAPMTEVAGAQLLNQAGIACFDLGGICHVKGGATTLAGSSVECAGGLTVVKGAPIEIGSVGAPIVTLPMAGAGGAGGPGSPKPPGGLSAEDALGLSGVAYEADRTYKTGDTIDFNGRSWEVEEAIDDPDGFQAMVVKDEHGNRVVAFAGTDFTTLPDQDDNVSQHFGGVPPQYEKADQLVARIKQQHPDVVVTGHSLGGGLANYTAGLHGVPGVGINSAPLGSGTLAQIANRGPVGGTDNFVHYNNQRDPISHLPGAHPGTLATMNNTRPIWGSHTRATVNPNDPIVVQGPLADEVYREYWRRRIQNPSMTRPAAPQHRPAVGP